MKEAWTEIKNYRQEAHIQRERHHEDMLRRSQLEGNGQKEKAIRAIQHAERRARQQMRINRVSGKPKGGVRMVYVPAKNKPGSWTMLAERKEVEQAIIDQNRSHLNEAGETPFAHGAHYKQLTDEKNGLSVMKEILDGETDWAHPMDKVDGWLDHLKYQYDVDNLREESKKLGHEMTYDEYKGHFKRKKETTESSKLGRHMGHYKAGLEDSTVTTIHIMMMNIPLLCGFAATQWKNQLR